MFWEIFRNIPASDFLPGGNRKCLLFIASDSGKSVVRKVAHAFHSFQWDVGRVGAVQEVVFTVLLCVGYS